MREPFVLAHLSDLHLGPLPPPPIALINVKRTLGYLNWYRKRKAIHRQDILERLITDLRQQHFHHIALTGDLINIGLPDEYAAAETWLKRMAAPAALTVVPGNHDIYTRLGGFDGIERWRAYMTGEVTATAFEPGRPRGFPFVRRLGRVALVGVNSAIPTRPLLAGGRVGREQCAALEQMLRQLRDEELTRVVLIHHPPLPGLARRSKALADAAEVAAVLSSAGAELVLYGHNHRFQQTLHGGPDGLIPVVGVPSASAARPVGEEPMARYHLFRIVPKRPIELIVRGLGEAGGPVREILRRTLAGATAQDNVPG
jgi:3',5'-cyclic AMP phosphodiesterase CpdA